MNEFTKKENGGQARQNGRFMRVARLGTLVVFALMARLCVQRHRLSL